MFIRNAFSKFKADFKADFDEVDYRVSSRITSNNGSTSSNAFLQSPSSRDDLPAIPFDSTEDEDDSNGQLQKRNLFQSLQHNSSYVSLIASSLSTKSGASSRPRANSSKLNLSKKTRDSISSSNSTVPTSYSNHSESSQQNHFMEKTLPPDPKRDEKMISATLRPKTLNGTHLDDFAQPVTRPKSPVDLPSVTSSSKTTDGNGVSPRAKEILESLSNSISESESVEIVVYPKEHFSSTSVSYLSYDVPPMIQPSVTQKSQSHDDSLTHNDDNLDAQQNTSETNNHPDSTPITQPPPLTSKRLPDIAVVRERDVPGDFVSDKPSTSPDVQNPPLDSTTSTPPNIQSRPLNSTTSTSSNIQSPSLNSTTTDSNPTSPNDSTPVRKATRRKPDMNSFLLNLVAPQVVSKEIPEKGQSPKTQPWGPPLRSLQRISESGDSLPSDTFTPAADDILARKMEELGRLRRMESRNLMSQSTTSPETLSSRTTATPKAELRPQLQTLQEDESPDVATLLREAYKERQQSLQTQLDKALAELRDVQAENKRLTSENQSQQRSISQLKTALETKSEQDNLLTQMKNQLRVANSSLTLLNKEKTGWQDKLDSMQDKVTAADRQVRCLDHLTRHKLESRHEAGYGQPKRRGLLASTPASTDIIGAMRAMNEEIYQTCVQFVEGLERTAVLTSQKPKVLGVHLTAMIEDQAKKATSDGYNMLLMQTVLEVFMTRWCSSIIDAFYPQQESFADLLVQLSAQTKSGSGHTAICGKQIKIIQSSTHDDGVKFEEWVKDIIKELGLLLTTAGLKTKPQCVTLFSTKTLALVKVAYNLRTAMAEKDICGGLEIVMVPADTPFQEKWMMDAHADPRKVDTDQSRVDYVAGTTGMGLHRKVSETVDGQIQFRMEMELKPKVTLAQALKSQQAKPFKSARMDNGNFNRI